MLIRSGYGPEDDVMMMIYCNNYCLMNVLFF